MNIVLGIMLSLIAMITAPLWMPWFIILVVVVWVTVAQVVLGLFVVIIWIVEIPKRHRERRAQRRRLQHLFKKK